MMFVDDCKETEKELIAKFKSDPEIKHCKRFGSEYFEGKLEKLQRVFAEVVLPHHFNCRLFEEMVGGSDADTEGEGGQEPHVVLTKNPDLLVAEFFEYLQKNLNETTMVKSIELYNDFVKWLQDVKNDTYVSHKKFSSTLKELHDVEMKMQRFPDGTVAQGVRLVKYEDIIAPPVVAEVVEEQQVVTTKNPELLVSEFFESFKQKINDTVVIKSIGFYESFVNWLESVNNKTYVPNKAFFKILKDLYDIKARLQTCSDGVIAQSFKIKKESPEDNNISPVILFVSELLVKDDDGYFTLAEAKNAIKNKYKNLHFKPSSLKEDLEKELKIACIGQKRVGVLKQNARNVFFGYKIIDVDN